MINNGRKTRVTTDISLINIFSDGPEVSLQGSPTVSPITVALWAGDPFPPKFPASTYFFALSQAPPAFARKIASRKPVAIDPIRSPPSPARPAPFGPMSPKTTPMIIGEITASNPGMIISRNARFVLMETHLL